MKKPALYLLLVLVAQALPAVERLSLGALSSEVNAWRARGGSSFVCANTGSMRPYVDGGDWLLAEKYTGGARVGDLVIFARWDSARVCHAVIEVNPRNGWVRTRGLNCAFADGWTSPQRVKFIARRVIQPVSA